MRARCSHPEVLKSWPVGPRFQGAGGPDRAAHSGMLTSSRRETSAGFTLIELMIVVSVIGLIVLFASPKIYEVYNRSMVRGARTTITNMYITARNQARTTNRVAVLRRLNDQVWVEVNQYVSEGTGKIIVRQPVDLGTEYGVTITAGDDSLRIDPRGMLSTSGSTFTYRFARRGTPDSVVISGYGRIQR